MLASGWATSGGAVAATSAAAGPASITILAPSADATVSGTVPVRLQVSGVASGALVTVRLTYQVLVTRPAPADCGASCEMTFTVDSLSRSQTPWVEEGRQIPDGPALLGASTAGADTWIGVTVDNHRPTVSAPDGGQSPVLVDHSYTAPLTVTAGPGSASAIASVLLWTPGYLTADPATWAQTTLPRPASGRPWTINLDTSSITPSQPSIYYAAVTADGTWSQVHRVVLRIDHGVRSVQGWPSGPILADQLRQLSLTADFGTTSILASSVTIQLDGDTIGAAAFSDPWLTRRSTDPLIVPITTTLPAGIHELRLRTTDTWGMTSTSPPATVTVLPAVTARWSVPEPVYVNQSVPIAAELSTVTEAMTTYSLNDHMTVIGTGTAPHVTHTWIPTTSGPHPLHLRVTQTDGDIIDLTRTVTVRADATATTLTLPPTAPYGTAILLRGNVTRADGPRRGQHPLSLPVTIQFRPAGTAAWQTVTTTTTVDKGYFGVSLTPRGSGQWRATATARRLNDIESLPSVSPTRSMSVTATVRAQPPKAVRARTAQVWQFTTTPHEPGLTLTVKIRKAGTSTWKTVARPAVSSAGRARSSLRMPARGTWQIMVTRPATLRCSTSTIIRSVRTT